MSCGALGIATGAAALNRARIGPRRWGPPASPAVLVQIGRNPHQAAPPELTRMMARRRRTGVAGRQRARPAAGFLWARDGHDDPAAMIAIALQFTKL